MIVTTNSRIGCSRAREAGTCTLRRTIPRAELEKRVVAGLADRLLAPEAVSRLVKSYHNAMAEHSRDLKRNAAALDRQIAKLDKVIERLVAAIASGATEFVEIREALLARKAEREALKRQREEEAADGVIALNPEIVETYRKRIRTLASHLGSDTAESAKVVASIRDIIAGVTLRPLNADEWSIEVISSLGSVVALATGGSSSAPRRGPSKSVEMVAKEGLEPPTPGL